MSKIDDYLILVEGGPPSNYGAWSPDVQGCVALGDTIDETVREMRTALVNHFELMREHGEAIPDRQAPASISNGRRPRPEPAGIARLSG